MLSPTISFRWVKALFYTMQWAETKLKECTVFLLAQISFAYIFPKCQAEVYVSLSSLPVMTDEGIMCPFLCLITGIY